VCFPVCVWLFVTDLSVVFVCVSGWEDSQYFRISVEPVGHPHVVQSLHHAGPRSDPLG